MEAADADLLQDWERGAYATWRAFLYCRVWSRVLMREAQRGTVDIPEDASAEDCKRLRMPAGLCVPDVALDPEGKIAVFDPTHQCSFKANSQVWLSRTDPEEDAFRAPLRIESVQVGEIRFPTDTVFPADASNGVWR